eukprot:9129006-Prorocentrum_lima.AAC.1
MFPAPVTYPLPPACSPPPQVAAEDFLLAQSVAKLASPWLVLLATGGSNTTLHTHSPPSPRHPSAPIASL